MDQLEATHPPRIVNTEPIRQNGTVGIAAEVTTTTAISTATILVRARGDIPAACQNHPHSNPAPPGGKAGQPKKIKDNTTPNAHLNHGPHAALLGFHRRRAPPTTSREKQPLARGAAAAAAAALSFAAGRAGP